MGSEIVTQNQLGQSVEWAKLVASSDIIPEAYKGKPANILIATGFGAAMGLSQAESLYRISVIKGKPTMSAELIAAQVRNAGHKLRIVKDEKKQSVTAIIVRRDDPDYPISVTRDLAWAHKMGLDQPNRNGTPSNYQKQPMTMLTWRAISAVAREACPEALFGAAYTPDEMHDMDQPQVTVHDVEPGTPSRPTVRVSLTKGIVDEPLDTSALSMILPLLGIEAAPQPTESQNPGEEDDPWAAK